jgi:hypothetical protein
MQSLLLRAIFVVPPIMERAPSAGQALPAVQRRKRSIQKQPSGFRPKGCF